MTLKSHFKLSYKISKAKVSLCIFNKIFNGSLLTQKIRALNRKTVFIPVLREQFEAVLHNRALIESAIKSRGEETRVGWRSRG